MVSILNSTEILHKWVILPVQSFIDHMITKKNGFVLLILALLLMGQGVSAQIDNNKGSFKIPAVKDSSAAKKEIETPKDSFALPRENDFKGAPKTAPEISNPKFSTKEEPSFYMLKKEQYADAGQRYTDMMNERQKPAERDSKPGHQEDQDLGTFNTGSKFVKIVCRDYSYVDGDRVAILVNDEVVQPEILLRGEFIGFNLDLKPGFNRISFQALNQGSSGPNTAQFVVYDDKGGIVSSNEWNLLTGVKANLLIVKE